MNQSTFFLIDYAEKSQRIENIAQRRNQTGMGWADAYGDAACPDFRQERDAPLDLAATVENPLMSRTFPAKRALPRHSVPSSMTSRSVVALNH